MQFFAAADGDVHFYLATEKIHRKRNERQALVAGLFGELCQFAAVEQQLASPFGLVIEKAGLRVNGNVAADEPQFTLADAGVGLFQRSLAVPQTLHFTPFQDEAALDLIQNLVLVPRSAIGADRLIVGIVGFLVVGFAGHVSRDSRCETEERETFDRIITNAALDPQ